jgi:radical SAM protein with 4Fe4S-binding SPASM domain
MDLALTYRCNDNCAHCYNARSRDYPELETADWLKILNTLWDVGIPHVCFTGGEATMRSDLPKLVYHAQSLGQITGLLSNGRRLSDRGYTKKLAEAGLDHVQITVESHNPEIHDHMVAAPGAWRQTINGLQNVLDSHLYVMTNTTLLTHNADTILETIDFLAEIGVPTVGINALIYAGKGSQVGTGLPESALPDLLERVRDRTDHHGQRLIWYTPTQYCHFDPVQMELGVKSCTAARYNMCVEPDGGVIPCQSYYQQVGNLLRDSWLDIWEHELSRWLRQREYVPQECHECAFLPECGGGCPLTLKHPSADKPVLHEVLPAAVRR